MKSKIQWWQLTIGFVAGLMIGGYLVFQFTSAFLLDGYYAGVLARTKINLDVLGELHMGNTQIAILSLEQDTDANVKFLSASAEEAAKLRADEIRKILIQADEYKRGRLGNDLVP